MGIWLKIDVGNNTGEEKRERQSAAVGTERGGPAVRVCDGNDGRRGKMVRMVARADAEWWDGIRRLAFSLPCTARLLTGQGDGGVRYLGKVLKKRLQHSTSVWQQYGRTSRASSHSAAGHSQRHCKVGAAVDLHFPERSKAPSPPTQCRRT